MSKTVYDVRIVEQYGRERVLAEFKKVTKEEAQVLLGGAIIAGSACHGEHTWVAPCVFIRLQGEKPWNKQRREVMGACVQAFKSHCEFTKVGL